MANNLVVMPGIIPFLGITIVVVLRQAQQLELYVLFRSAQPLLHSPPTAACWSLAVLKTRKPSMKL